MSENSKGMQTDNSGNGLQVKSLRMEDQETNDTGESGEGQSELIPSMYLSPHADQREGNHWLYYCPKKNQANQGN